MTQRTGSQGWMQFLANKQKLVDGYFYAKNHADLCSVKVRQGKTAEVLFKFWLAEFLPKKYGVTSGYIISRNAPETQKTPHYDLIIYDVLECPTLWVEGLEAKEKAIPAEYVLAVIEVKSSFNSQSTKSAITHLSQLESLYSDLPPNFMNYIVFFELQKKYEFNKKSLNNLIPLKNLRGYWGAVILSGEGVDRQKCAVINLLTGKLDMKSTVGKKKHSMLDNSVVSDVICVSELNCLRTFMHWSEAHFANFMFDILAGLKGTLKVKFTSQGYCYNHFKLIS